MTMGPMPEEINSSLGQVDVPERGTAPTKDSAQGHSLSHFLRLLFRLLDEHQIRYCVLHSWEGLPDKLPSDLDMAVPPRDVAKVAFVFRALADQGYQPVQCLNHAESGYCFHFVWFEGAALKSISVDLIYEYRRGGLVLTPGEELVARRQRRGLLWTADPATEFAYLLAKKTFKGFVPARQEQRLKRLVEELGQPEAERVAAPLFGERWKGPVVESCANGCAGDLLGKLKKRLWWTVVSREPLNPVRCALGNAARLVRRWFQPTGLFVVVLGPDGVGKSTLIERLTRVIAPPFQSQKIFHLRPMLLWRRHQTGPVTDPHGRSPRSRLGSVAKLVALLPDYWLGYGLLVRPLLARSGLVVFDRYFHDLLVDPKRYRYAGPMWLARLFSRIVPGPDLLFLVLDAPEQVILSRKREVLIDELRRQRVAYHNLKDSLAGAVLIHTDRDIDSVLTDSFRAIMEHLARRFRRRHAGWLAVQADSGWQTAHNS